MPAPPCYELDRLSLLSAPHEPAADRTPQLQAIADCEFLCEIGRDFAVRQSFDG